MKRSLFLCLIALIAVTFASGECISATHEVSQITGPGHNTVLTSWNAYPYINSKGDIAWQGRNCSDALYCDLEIFFYAASTEITTQITSDPDRTTAPLLNDNKPQINSKGDIVWYRSTANDYATMEILLYEALNSSITQLTSNAEYDIDPQINENSDIVWDSSSSAGFYDSLSGSITLHSGAATPDININKALVYLKWLGSEYDVFRYNTATNAEVNISDPSDSGSNHNDWYPQISDNGSIVWQKAQCGSACTEIYYYDASTDSSFLISPSSYNNHPPRINILGDAVWHGFVRHPVSNIEYAAIFFYDASTGQTSQITELPDGVTYLRDTYPEINAQGDMVWMRNDGADRTIVFRDSATGQETVIGPISYTYYQMNDAGDIVWGHSDGPGYASQIFLAKRIANTVPTANAGENIAITSEEIASSVIQGMVADEDPGDELSCRWLTGETVLMDWTSAGINGECALGLNPAYISLGTQTLILEVSDGKAQASDTMMLTIENSAPHAAPIGGGVYEVHSEVILDGDVSDFDGDLLTYEWRDDDDVLFSGSVQTIAGGSPVQLPVHGIATLSLGFHTITLEVNDGFNDPVSRTVTVKIVDTTVPTLAPVQNKAILWPPNHEMVDIVIDTNASDNSGLPIDLTASVLSSEPAEGLGDGDVYPDWTEPAIDQVNRTISLQLRAERSGSGNGRTYAIAITATDSSGNSNTVGLEIIIPHDKSKK